VVYSLDLLAVLAEEGRNLLAANRFKLAAVILESAHESYVVLSADTFIGESVGDAGSIDASMTEDVETMGLSVLTMLAMAHLRAGGGADKAMKCLEHIQRHTMAATASLSVAVLMHEALLQTGRVEEAQTELLKIVTHENTSPEVCASSLKASLMSSGGAGGARAALAAALEVAESGKTSKRHRCSSAFFFFSFSLNESSCRLISRILVCLFYK